MSTQDRSPAEVRAARWQELGAACRDGEAGRSFARLGAALDAVAHLEAPPVTAAARRAAVRVALGPAEPRARARARRWAVGLAGALALGAVALVLVARVRREPVEAGPRVVAGSLRPVGPGELVEAVIPAEVRLADGSEVAVAARTRLSLSRRRVDLRLGRVTLHVRRAQGEAFVVTTPRATVRVLGTRFIVEHDDRTGVTVVSVTEGVVAVEPTAQGSRRLLRAGEQVVIGAPPPVREPAPPAAAVAPEPAKAPPRSAPRVDRSAASDALLRRAEDLVAQGRYSEATAGYLRVAAEHPDPVEAELALFAAASLTMDHGGPARARPLLERYLSRYPRGRFVAQARKLLSPAAAPR